MTPTEVIVVRPYDDGPAVRLRESGARMISRPDERWKRCDIKSTNLLANVLASEAARRAGCHEAVLLDSEGYVTEATHSSLLWVREGRLEGTPEGHEILPGMTRGLTLKLIKPMEISFASTRITLPALHCRRRGDPGRHDVRGSSRGRDRRTVDRFRDAPGPIGAGWAKRIATRSSAGRRGRGIPGDWFLSRRQGTPRRELE